MERNISALSKIDCCGCSACTNACPQKCIEMKADAEGFCYPQIDKSLCVDCGLCAKSCPVLSEMPEQEGKAPEAYAAMNLDEEERLSSSSGGVFILLARAILQQGGVVFGAAFGEDCRSVSHICVEKEEELGVLQGSKYLQSTIGDAYQQAERFLEDGRQVLFSGTPCQIEGLKAYLKKDYAKLICVDIICHGVPSPKVWRKYVDFRCAQAQAPVRRTFSRHKKYGWKTFAVLFEFSNNTAYEAILSEDCFMQAFLQNACLRPSCCNCHFKKLNHVADITLADFWGIHNVLPEMDDDKGTSLILLHSEKGRDALDETAEDLFIQPAELGRALNGNSAYLKSVLPHKKRAQFFKHLDALPFDRLVARYAKKPPDYKGLIRAGLEKAGLWSTANRIRKKMRAHKGSMDT